MNTTHISKQLFIILTIFYFSSIPVKSIFGQGVYVQQPQEIQRNISSIETRLDQTERKIQNFESKKEENKSVAECKFDIFNNLLILLLSLATVIGGLLFLLLKELMRGHIERRFSALKGSIYITDGLRDYDRENLKRAIEYTEKALKEKLDEKSEIWAKNNLAYYYAEIYEMEKYKDFSKSINKKRVLKFAEFVFNKYNPIIQEYNEPSWVETYVFVKSKFAKTKSEIDKLKKFIGELLSEPLMKDKKDNLSETLEYLNKKVQG